MNNEWLITYDSQTIKPNLRLVCFPFAGGGTVNYAKWRSSLREDIELCALNLPGRERFFGQPVPENYHEVVKKITDLIEKKPECNTLFFGHSFGGLTAYFSALELKKRGLPAPCHLIISARTPPLADKMIRISHLPTHEFQSTIINKYEGIPEQIANSPELLSLFIPMIQADFKLYEQFPMLLETYKNQSIDSTITSIAFMKDSPNQDLFWTWKNYTLGGHHHVQMPGGHFEILSNWKPVVDLINQL